MGHAVRTVIRVMLGLLGLQWFIGGTVSLARAFIDAETDVMLISAFPAVLGFILVYFAFRPAAWKSDGNVLFRRRS